MKIIISNFLSVHTRASHQLYIMIAFFVEYPRLAISPDYISDKDVFA